MRIEASFISATFEQLLPLLRAHMQSLAQPPDSFLEEQLEASELLQITLGDTAIGYAAILEGALYAFYVAPAYYRFAPDILETLVASREITLLHVLTHDSRLLSLLMEWDYSLQEREACWFTDGGRTECPAVCGCEPLFRLATAADEERIRQEIDDFFDPLPERIAADTIFVLEDKGDLLGFGIVEKSKLRPGFVSIGMITAQPHRRRGVASRVLWQLKEWAYEKGQQPIAGCWYYNTLSRKSLEAVGMIASAKGYFVRLKERIVPPVRTGNPPREDV